MKNTALYWQMWATVYRLVDFSKTYSNNGAQTVIGWYLAGMKKFFPKIYCGLTPSLRRPCIHAIVFSTACRTACKHAFRFLRVLPEAVSTRHSWLWQMLDDVYTRRCFSESEGNTLRCPRTKGTAVGEWVNGMEWVNGFLPNSFIHELFCWSSRHKFVKTDL